MPEAPQLLRQEVGRVGRHERQRRLDQAVAGVQAPQEVAQAADPVRHGEPDRKAAHRQDPEIQRHGPDRERAGRDGAQGELERDEARRVVHQALAVQDRGHARGHPQALGHRADGDGVGRRDDGAQGERHREGQAGHERMRDQAHRQRREDDEPHGQEEDRPLGLGQLAQRHEPAVGEDERRQEAEEEEAGVEREPREAGHEGRGDAAEEVRDEERPGQPAGGDAQARDQEKQEERVLEGVHGPSAGRVPRRLMRRRPRPCASCAPSTRRPRCRPRRGGRGG